MKTNYCPKCGKELDEGGLFCGFCGIKLDSVKPFKITLPREDRRPLIKRITVGICAGFAIVGITIGLLLFITSNKSSDIVDSSSDTSALNEDTPIDSGSYVLPPITHPDINILSATDENFFEIPEDIKLSINTNAQPEDYLSGYSGYTGKMRITYSDMDVAAEVMASNNYSQEDMDAYFEENSRCADVSFDGTASVKGNVLNALFSDYGDDPILIWDNDTPLEETEPGIFYEREDIDISEGQRYQCKTICFLNDGSIFALLGFSESSDDNQLMTHEIRILLIPNEEKRPEHHSDQPVYASPGESASETASEGIISPEISSDNTQSNTVTSQGSQSANQSSSEATSQQNNQNNRKENETHSTTASNTTESNTTDSNTTDSNTTGNSSGNNGNQSGTGNKTSESNTEQKPSGQQYPTSSLPEKSDFDWYLNDVKKNGVWSDSQSITSFDSISGGWKCSIIYNRSSIITMDCREDVNLEITGKASSVKAVIHWGTLYIEGEDPIDESYIEDTSMKGKFTNNTLKISGSCDITFSEFFTRNNKQYAIGNLSTSEGESATVVMVRP